MYKLHRNKATIDFPELRLFRGLVRNQIDVIRAAGVERTFLASDVIVRIKEPSIQLFLIKRGLVNYSVLTDQGREILLDRLVPGDIFGIAAVLSEPSCYLGTAKALYDTDVLVWDHRLIHQLAIAYPRLGENALAISLRSVAEHAERHVRLVSSTARERVAFALAKLGVRAGRILTSGVEIDINNEDLASLADVNLFTASRLLKRWERQGILEKRRGKVLLRSPEKLLAA